MAESGGWSTIESDEGVFTALIENLGVKEVQFEALLSLDADTIRSLRYVSGQIGRQLLVPMP
jgi:ubiquitin carboxyl-terminal hydrolase L5